MRGDLTLNKSDLSARIVKLSTNSSDEKKCSKQLISVIFDNEWKVIQMIQLILFPTNLLILYIIVFFVNYFVIKLIDILKKMDSLWISRCGNGNVLNDDLKECQVSNGLKSVLLKTSKLSNDTTSLIYNMIMISKMVCNNNTNNNNLFFRLYINRNDDGYCDYFILILYNMHFRHNAIYCSAIRMGMRKRMRKKKIIITTTILCARMNIVFIFLVIDKTDRCYSMILILYIILDGMYQLMYQFMIKNKGKHSNIFQENLIYRSVLYDVIIFRSIIIILYGLYTMKILEIINCRNRKVRMRKRKRKCKDKNTNNNVMCKDGYLILFLVMDNTNRNDIVLNIYSVVLILYVILHGIYQLNCQNITESKVKHSNISQYRCIYFDCLHYLIGLDGSNIKIMTIVAQRGSSNMNKSDSNNIKIYECGQMNIFIID